MFSTQGVIDVTKAAVSQLIAKGFGGLADSYANIDYLDDQLIVDLGEALTLSGDDFAINSPADIMFKALLSQIGKVVIDNRKYIAQLPSLFVDTMNWGLFREQVLIELSDVMIDEMWNPDGFIGWTESRLVNGVTVTGPDEGARIAAIEFGCYKPPVSAKIYKRAHGAMVALTTAREQFFTAFKSVDEYSAFIAGLYNSVENTLQVKAEIYALMTVSMGIAKSIANGNCISLRDEYAALTGSTLPNENDKLMHIEDFQRFMLRRFYETEKFAARFTAAYNDHTHITFAAQTQKILLEHAVSAAKFGVRANTYNERLLGIGDYDSCAGWQAVTSAGVTTDRFTLDTSSTIMLTAAAAAEAGLTSAIGDTVTLDGDDNATITGIIGVVYDRLAMGVTLDKRKVTTQYSASRDTVNSFYHALVNYCVNDSYPIISFTLNSLTSP